MNHVAFVGAANPDVCAIQMVGSPGVVGWSDGMIETQDDDGTWYPCTFNSVSGFLQQVYFNRTMPINDFTSGTPWRIVGAPSPQANRSGTMV